MRDPHCPYDPPLATGATLPVPAWRALVYDVVESTKALLRTRLKAHQVRPVVLRGGLGGARIVVVLLVKDEAPRLPFLLGHYRRIGVEHFLVIDNESGDDVLGLLANEPDVSLFAARGSYHDARFGNDWVNLVLRRHCIGKWVVWIDSDEILIFSGRGGARLAELTAALDARGQESLQSLMLDMYSARPPAENVVGIGTDPLSVCDLYDRSGYVSRYETGSGTTWIKGGIRGRLFFPDVWTGPALNKTPVVKWRRHYAFLKSAHQLWPRRLNGCGRVESVLLHFKFTATSAQKMNDDVLRAQHTPEYDAYSQVRTASFVDDVTTRFVDGRNPAEDGLYAPVV